MFLHLSVSHSVHRGEGCLPQCMLGYTPLGRHPLGRHPLGRYPSGQAPPSRYPLGRHPPGQAPPPSRRLLLRTVRILLECILVFKFCFLVQSTGRNKSEAKKFECLKSHKSSSLKLCCNRRNCRPVLINNPSDAISARSTYLKVDKKSKTSTNHRLAFLP